MLSFRMRAMLNSSMDDAIKDYVPLQQHPTISIFFIAINSIIGILSISGNTLVLYVKGKENRSSPESNRTKIRYFVMSLALSDILAGLISLPVTILMAILYRAQTDLMCKVVRYIGIVGPVVTTNNLVVMALERYACVFYPLKVPSRHTIIQCIIIAWVTGSLLTLLPARAYNVIPVDIDDRSYTMQCRVDPMHKHLFLGFSICAYVLPCAGLIATSAAIGRLLYRKRNRIGEENQPSPREHASRFQGSRMLIAITFAMILPYITYFTYLNISLYVKAPISFTSDCIIRMIMTTACYSKGFFNVLIYIYYMKNIGKTLKAIVCRKKTGPDQSLSHGATIANTEELQGIPR
ncbi:neuropeptide FF receptor 2 [Nematostella vectensis]|uniref:neuropeptide FF receptor 2 n=1 Tax=Nematostella vectensis TaxID=45351 RepID=UPI002076DA1F|nr:neuropeptide FF receptor 2 [Nematostella vectensis]XP_048587218.1 neuropeptide FF receptor 2 [Nematostella vectensis]